MSTKVEQLVMGAFWEAAADIHRSDRFRLTQEELERMLALFTARYIRVNIQREFLKEHDRA